MPTPETIAKQWVYSSRVRTGAALASGVAGGLASLVFRWRPMAPLVGWDVGALVFVLWALLTNLRLDEANTAGLASSESPGRLSTDLALIAASLASLGAVGMTLIDAGNEKGLERTILVVTGIVSVFLSWLLVHVVYTLVYARLYYDEAGARDEIDFNEDGDPDYRDFAYLAFTVGMTFQVSDTDIKSKRIRRAVLHHATLSYLFGTVIVATTVNFVAGLGK